MEQYNPYIWDLVNNKINIYVQLFLLIAHFILEAKWSQNMKRNVNYFFFL